MRTQVRWLSYALAVAVIAFAAACGGGGDDNNGDATSTPLLAPRTTATTDGVPGATSTPGATEPDGGPGGNGPPAGGIVLRIPRAGGAVGTEVTAELLLSGFPEPGLGAWTVDISYDNGALSAEDCGTAGGTSLCNPDFDDDTVRFAGAAVPGIVGDFSLGTLTFTCEDAGTSELEISLVTFADATAGDPQHVESSVTIENGEVECE